MTKPSCSKEQSRRNFLRLGVTASAAGVLATSGLDLVFPTLANAQSTLTPDAALNELMEGNKRYTSGHMGGQQNLEKLRQQTAEKQEPFAAVLACADSRVPVELVFDQSIGQLFVARVAGNVITPEIIGSLEYGALVLGTKAIMVLGHSSCGAVHAALEGKAVPGQISALFPHIQPAIDQAGHDLVGAIKANAKIQATLLSQSSTVISGLIKENKVKVVAGYYDLASGTVTQVS